MNCRSLAALVVLLPLLAACSGGDAKPSPTPSPSATDSPSESPSAPPSPLQSPVAPATVAPTRSTDPQAPPPPAVARSLGYPFLMHVGETVSVDGEGLTLTYERLLEDSRCPPDVQCIWAGNGRILLTLIKAGSAPAGVELNTMLEPKAGRYLDYSVSLDDLGREEPPTATVQVNRA